MRAHSWRGVRVSFMLTAGVLLTSCPATSLLTDVQQHIVSSQTPPDQVATPTFSPTQGMYSTDQSVSISCATSGAFVYYTTNGTDPSTASQVFNAASPILVHGPMIETIKAIAVKSGLRDSDIASAIYWINPSGPGVPQISSAVGGIKQVTVSWTAVSGSPTSYNLYWARGATVSTTTHDGVISCTVLTQVVGGLADGTQYAFIVTAVNGAGESAPSPVVTANTAPGAPTPSAVGGSQQVTVSWGTVSGATSYNLYWKQGSTVTTLTGTKVSNVVSPQVIGGLADVTQYAFIVTAVGIGGESPASSVVTANTAVATPQFNPGGGNNYVLAQSVTISSTSGATIRYTTNGSTPSESTGNLYSSPVNISSNPTTLKAIAYKSGFPDSQIFSVVYAFVPPGAPTTPSANGGHKQVTVSWATVSGATSYNVYWKKGSTVSTGSHDGVDNTSGSPDDITGLQGGNHQYAFIVTAVGIGGESAASPVVTANTN